MSKQETTTYHCDRCGKQLEHSRNSVDIVTSLKESGYWSRLHVQILHRHGVNNDATVEQADLCQPCASHMLDDALQRIRHGERATAGTESALQGTWE